MTTRVLLLALVLSVDAAAADPASLVNVVVVPGASSDRSPLAGTRPGANVNRLGGFGSDLYYDRRAKVFYGLTDRGPGGGTIKFGTRVQKFSIDINSVTGAAGNFRLLATIPFTIPAAKTVHGIAGPQTFNGVDPALDSPRGAAASVGRSHDPEGFVVAPSGHFYVSDEYGPDIYEFLSNGAFVREFTPPSNVLPRDANGLNFSSARSVVLVSGRQRNRGFEGLAISPDGGRLFAMLQDPLVEEGSAAPRCTARCTPPGRFSRNVRIIVYSTATGQSVAQYIYQLEDLAAINARVPRDMFDAGAQGTNIGISALTAINDHEFLVLERDNRGAGVDDPTGTQPVSTKRMYRIDIAGATNVGGISLAGSNALPVGIVPVAKTLFIDVLAELQAAGATVPDKIEGVAIGPRLRDGAYELLVSTDNDFSVTQNDSGKQFDVCTNGTISQQVPIDSGCPAGLSLLPTFFISFKVNESDLRSPPAAGEIRTKQ